jgi:hypothetical protein
MKERPWYPPNSFTHVPHWVVQVRRITGEWRTYTEHPTADNARKHWKRLVERWPNTETRYIGINVPFDQYTPAPSIVPLGFS